MQKIDTLIADALFPVRCLNCGAEKKWLCQACQAKIILHSEQVCPHCEKIATPDGRTCFTCQTKTPLAGIFVLASYRDPLLAKAIHTYKYRFVSEISQPLGELLTKKLQITSLPLPDLIIPVPLFCRRLRWRGFNQAELLAQTISQNLISPLEIPLANNLLLRHRNTKSQMQLTNFKERRHNLRNAFGLNQPRPSLVGKKILLVDDVITTGATLNECARVLHQAGANQVWAAVLARQEFKNKPGVDSQRLSC